MKKKALIILSSLAVLAVAVVSIIKFTGFANRPDSITDLIELDEVSAFVSEKGYTAEDFKEKLAGQYYEDIIHAWGEADIQFSGVWGHSWYLDDNNDKYISLCYDENGYVEEIKIENNTEVAHISDESAPDSITFEAEILEIYDGYFLVKSESSWAMNSADQIEVPIKNSHPSPEPEIGDVIEIKYSGEILETYPARIVDVYNIKVVTETETED